MRKRGFSGEILWQWNEVPILWAWVFCLISGGGKLGWGSNMLLFGYGSLGRGGMLTREGRGASVLEPTESAHSSLPWRRCSFPACILPQPSFQIMSLGPWWLNQASVKRQQPMSRHFRGAGFSWQREPMWNSSASLWYCWHFQLLPHPQEKKKNTSFYYCI